MDQTLYLLLVTFFAILLLLVLVIKLKLHAFISLLLVSAFVGLGAGMSFDELLKSIQEGMGSILGYIAIVVGVGSILGKLLEVSGGTETLAGQIVKTFGEKRSPWALAITGFIIAIPVFLEVGFIILVPIIYSLSKKSGLSTLHYAIPLLAGLAVTHAFIPPTPGPVAVSEILNVPLGWVILMGAIAGIPAAIIAGPIFGKYIAKKIHLTVPDYIDWEEGKQKSGSRGDFAMVLFVIFFPLFLILISTFLEASVTAGSISGELFWVQLLQFIGHPFSALTIATLIAGYFLGIKKGFTSKELLAFSDNALAPAGLVILVTGAGGVFKQILISSGVGEALAQTLLAYQIIPLVLAFIIAAVIRITQGSATVAMITAAGMMAPVIGELGLSDPHKALIVISIAAGSTIMSHVNDSGFWLVNKYLGMTEKQTLRSWTVMETIIAFTGFGVALLLSLFFV
ncbi:MAG: gluconate:H+ symporter [Marinoscillum sp.]